MTGTSAYHRGAKGAFMRRSAVVLALALLATPPGGTLSAQAKGSSGPGAPPSDAWTCPASHPIKGNLTTRTGECIYHVRGGAFYGKTKPERCFATEEEARLAGCRRSSR